MASDDAGRHNPTPFDELLGHEVVAAADGVAEVRLDLGPRHRNRRGVAHGGVVASLLDIALGAAVISGIRPEEWCGTLELSVQFRDPARRGPLVARGRLARRGRHVAFAEGEVRDADDRQVAAAHGVWTIWPGHPDRSGDDGQS